MPRRIRLDFALANPTAPCGLTGTPDSLRVTGWRQRPRGANYAAWGLVHPLTPHYRLKPSDQEWLPIHPQPGGIGYRHWVGLVTAAPEGARLPAKAVAEWRREGQRARPGRGAPARCRLRHGQHEGPRLRRERDASSGRRGREGTRGAGRLCRRPDPRG
nr:type I-E CRISPR-associated protein Cse1/CasA [Roseomonas sp. SXEYE001]